MMERGGRDNEIGLREGVPSFATFFDQQAPLEHHIFTNREHSLFEHGPQFVSQPVRQLGAAIRFAQQFDTETYFGERDGTDEQASKRLHGNEG